MIKNIPKQIRETIKMNNLTKFSVSSHIAGFLWSRPEELLYGLQENVCGDLWADHAISETLEDHSQNWYGCSECRCVSVLELNGVLKTMFMFCRAAQQSERLRSICGSERDRSGAGGRSDAARRRPRSCSRRGHDGLHGGLDGAHPQTEDQV